jgi:shikimate kinase
MHEASPHFFSAPPRSDILLENGLVTERGNVALIGLMGAGKTTLGKLLGKRLAKTFVDSDVEIVRVTGVEIATIFEIEGETAFRDREESVIAELLSRSNHLISTGGGVVIREGSRRALQQNALVVYLHALPNTVWSRIKHHRGRPLLATNDPLKRLEQLYAERDVLYRAAAHIVVDVSNEPPGTIAGKIELALAQHLAQRNPA